MEHHANTSIDDVLLVDDNEKQKRLFMLGLFILFCWVVVIILCAYPQLYRDLLLRYVCCCFAGFAVRRREKCRQRADQLAKARERVRAASKSFISVSTAVSPTAIMLKEIGLSELRQGNAMERWHHYHQRTSKSEPIGGQKRGEREAKIFLLDRWAKGEEEEEQNNER
ncbi:hypothetical protein niasHT_025867 [Heterodera trifolii]|uniref:Transmembrane protein n=1 Tax=Heterodera trifolii TaxID=157864 RepID=A0ABD2KJ72_9BILA